MRTTEPTTTKPAILVVDDVLENVELLDQLLSKRGYAVRRAMDGNAAIKSARETPPDLILLDINMPELSGYDVARILGEDKKLAEIPIVFLSSMDDTNEKVRAFASGGVDYVTKPFQFAEVEARITTHLKIRRLQVQLEERNRTLRRVNELRENLTAASKLAMWWTYYHQFDYQAAGAECRKSALDFFGAFDRLAARDPSIADDMRLREVDATVGHLREWANDSSPENPAADALNLTNVLLMLTIYRSRIEAQLNDGTINTDEVVHPDIARRLESYLRWRGHFPLLKTRANLQEVMVRASRSTSIIVVGDIRRSQDLMTYALDEGDFSKRMVEFIATTRQLLDRYGGFFDKFTGDGFLGYFNEAICEAGGLNYIDSFLNFTREFTAFCRGHFREWIKHVRKAPVQEVGLAMGADCGTVSFQSLDYHVVAVSESIVWASRMASAAEAEEVLANNLLYQSLRERKDLKFVRREAATKSGEGFLAWTLCLNSRDRQ